MSDGLHTSPWYPTHEELRSRAKTRMLGYGVVGTILLAAGLVKLLRTGSFPGYATGCLIAAVAAYNAWQDWKNANG
ncbi:hypothetical protein ABDK56_00885 [Sphingomonas sp. ASV193]|uniref:hypothetical protein n=1 Tax=Sphingomonas sp. ASV193 TaxID=3144405 RepID=UPI0032E90C3F